VDPRKEPEDEETWTDQGSTSEEPPALTARDRDRLLAEYLAEVDKPSDRPPATTRSGQPPPAPRAGASQQDPGSPPTIRRRERP
jgi:hypothetical protein